jgi:hypothetical protein
MKKIAVNGLYQSLCRGRSSNITNQNLGGFMTKVECIILDIILTALG